MMQCATIAFVNLPRNRQQILAAITIGGKIQSFATDFEVAQPDAHRQDVGLTAGVVDVVLAEHVVASGFEHARQRGAIRRLTAMPDKACAMRRAASSPKAPMR